MRNSLSEDKRQWTVEVGCVCDYLQLLYPAPIVPRGAWTPFTFLPSFHRATLLSTTTTIQKRHFPNHNEHPEMPLDATLPPIRRVLKRSASTASLPTPPRTHSKRGRGRSRGSCDSDSDDQVVLLSDEEELAVSVHKKRRTGEATQEGEDAFWLGTGAMTTRSKTAFGSSNSKAVDPSTQAPLVYRRRQAQSQQQQQPVSPPPSHRKPMVVSPTNNAPTTPVRTSPRFARAPSTASPPVTPKRKSQRRTTSVLRDSPQNPFLASPLDAVPESESEESPNPSPKTPYQEKPTVAYVL